MTRSADIWSARQVYLAADASKGSLIAAIRAGHMTRWSSATSTS
ncbi:MAG: hypothetical protein QOE23_2150 [Pseudonocardiales bacterium]|jgi:hypothetical protein|nr:hypothetical protein [Pseudonocardiales bacterium]